MRIGKELVTKQLTIILVLMCTVWNKMSVERCLLAFYNTLSEAFSIVKSQVSLCTVGSPRFLSCCVNNVIFQCFICLFVVCSLLRSCLGFSPPLWRNCMPFRFFSPFQSQSSSTFCPIYLSQKMS